MGLGLSNTSVEKHTIFAIMINNVNENQEARVDDFLEEYNKIVNSPNTSVVIKTEWKKKGDSFLELSMYDNSYVSIGTSANTTLT
jgi:hypothetical protein